MLGTLHERISRDAPSYEQEELRRRIEEEQRYQEAVHAVDELYALSLEQKIDKGRIRELTEIYLNAIRVLQNRILDVRTLDATLPIVYRASLLVENYGSDESWLIDSDRRLGLRDAVSHAETLLAQIMIPTMVRGIEGYPESAEVLQRRLEEACAVAMYETDRDQQRRQVLRLFRHFACFQSHLKEPRVMRRALPLFVSFVALPSEPPFNVFRAEVINCISRHLPEIEAELVGGVQPEVASDCFNIIYALASDREFLGAASSTAMDILERYRDIFQEQRGLAAVQASKEYVGQLTKFGLDHIVSKNTYSLLMMRARQEIERISGLRWDDLFGAWCESNTRKDESIVAALMHAQALLALEEQEKGAAKLLHDYYGISDFGRYPLEMLVEQAREHENTERPYGVMEFPRHDHSGALATKQHVLQQMYGQLRGKYLVRIFEAETKLNVFRHLTKLQNDYGAHHKIAFAILAGHGTESSIQLGSWGTRQYIRLKNTEDRRMGAINRFFEPRATVILFSCSTGKTDGIAQRLSEELGLTVIAPDQETSPVSVDVFETDEDLSFEVKYDGARTMVYDGFSRYGSPNRYGYDESRQDEWNGY